MLKYENTEGTESEKYESSMMLREWWVENQLAGVETNRGERRSLTPPANVSSTILPMYSQLLSKEFIFSLYSH